MLAVYHKPPLSFPTRRSGSSQAATKMVLDAMVRQEYISQRSGCCLQGAAILSAYAIRYRSPHFVMYIRNLLEKKYGSRTLYSGGLTVRTTLDLDMQRVAERIARQQVEKLAKDNIHNAALVAIRPSTERSWP